MDVSRQQIEEAVNSVTGNPSSGIVHDLQPAIIDAVMAVVAPPAPTAKSKRVLEVDEVR